MQGYRSLTEAVQNAAENCTVWQGVSDGQQYSLYDMTILCQIVDMEAPLTDSRFFYVVFPDGEIGLLCTEDRLIDRLFLAVHDRQAILEAAAHDRQELDARLSEIEAAKRMLAKQPARQPTKKRPAFCRNCGNPLPPKGKFCENCGSPVEEV